MKCNICNKTLEPDEIQWHPLHESWDPCGTCLNIISEVFDDHPDEEEITDALEEEWPEVFEPEVEHKA